MASNLVIEKDLSQTAQSVKDQNGNTSQLTLSTNAVGIGTTSPIAGLHVSGDGNDGIVCIERSGKLLALNPNYGGRNEFAHISTYVGSDMGLKLDVNEQTRLTITTDGNVGIGTTNPLTKLYIVGTAPADANDAQLGIAAPNGNLILFGRAYSYGFVQSHNREPLALNPLGNNVGIGTTNPQEKLEVHGNILATGDVRLSGADCAEEFEVQECQVLDPGMVMIIGNEDKLHRCTKAYDKRVAGVLSGAGDYKPGIVLNKQQSQNKRMPLALTGKVFCKVDAKYSPIGVGDLLTTSPTPGHAMKADNPLKAFGAVIGKALRALTEGQDLIPVLVALQ